VTFEERVRALAHLHLTERQTRFVVIVALHGGYCLRRQYSAFAGIAQGHIPREFLDLLVSRSHARRFQFRRDRGYVYHLHRTSLYEAIEQRDNRNRRHVSSAAIARKLMVLDHVLGEPNGDWYATEDDKVELFTKRFGCPTDRLPQRTFIARQGSSSTTRYFIHKLPIELSRESLRPSFVYLVTDTTGAGLTQFLTDHAQLLDALPSWRVVAIAPPHSASLKASEIAFQRFCSRLRLARNASGLGEVRAYFLRRRAIERNELTSFDKGSFSDAAKDWRRAQYRFGTEEYDALYRRWLAAGDSVLTVHNGDRFLDAVDSGRGELVTRVLPYRYDRFGTLAGLS
jgi:hypothetical protein